jgi:DNA-directed RNA polymerase subunit beta'
MNQLREVATKRDQLILDEREKEAAIKAEAQIPKVALPAAE